MLARMDPKHHMVSLLSIPRDLWVPSLGNKINSAYSEGGDAKSLEAVEAVTGVKPELPPERRLLGIPEAR